MLIRIIPQQRPGVKRRILMNLGKGEGLQPGIAGVPRWLLLAVSKSSRENFREEIGSLAY
ncbi:MAG TPA: hypothetical protein VJM80_09095 [bacterium]|nr:hypothetical protein [bacterium]